MKRWWWVVVATVGLAAVAHGQVADPNAPVMDAIASGYRLASEGWLARLMPVAQRTFIVLAGIEVAISGALYGFRREALDELAGRFVLKIGVMAFLFGLITSYATWIPPIVNGFATAGEQAIGATGTVDPSDVLDIGVSLAGLLLHALDGMGVLQHPTTAMFGALSAAVVLGAYITISAQLLITLVESYVVLTGGVVFLGFAAWRVTAGYAEGFLNYAVFVGARIFLLYLVVGVGVDLSLQWLVALRENAALDLAGTLLWQVVGGAVVFAILAVTLPKGIASRVTARPSLGVAAALRSL
jgi:type IV secretion system protein TrbL